MREEGTASAGRAARPALGAGPPGASGAPGEDLDLAALIAVAPGLLRIATLAWLRTTEWAMYATLGAAQRVLRAAASGESAADLAAEVSDELRQALRRLLVVLDEDLGEEEVIEGTASDVGAPAHGPGSTAELRALGAELLRRSADVRYEEPAHPAYEVILGQLAPDEARILRLLEREGAQPSVDVRVGRPLNPQTQMAAPGLSMIGAQAGVRFVERVPAYLNNLYRLGLIWFSREPLEDPLRYQVLEAQPEVIEARRGARRSKTVRRSIHLTPFGEDFVEICLPGGERPPSAPR